MTSPQTYSMDSQPLTVTPEAGVAGLSITGSASLMTNFEPSRAVDCNERIQAIQDVNGRPMVFSVGTNGNLFAILNNPGPGTGWRQVELTSDLVGSGKVEAFGAVALENGTFSLAISVNDGSTATVHVTPALSADPQAAFWSDFSGQFVARPATSSFACVRLFVMGPSDKAGVAGVVAMASKDGQSFQRYIVSGDPSVTDAAEIWDAWALPDYANADSKVLGLVIGKNPRLNYWGTYALYCSGTDVACSFTTFAKVDGTQRQNTELADVPQDAVALAAAHTDYSSTNSTGGWDLYLAGENLWHYGVVAQVRKNGPKVIARGTGSSLRAQLDVLCDGKTISVWLLNNSVLTYVESATDGSTGWSTPLPLRQGVGQISAIRNTRFNTDQLFEVDGSSGLSYFYRDPRSTLWREVDVPLADAGAAIPYDGYTTCIHFADDTGVPWSGPMRLSASSWVQVTVNGTSYMLGTGQSIDVAPDPSGALTIITKASNTSMPVFTISGDGFEEVIDVAPQQIVTQNLKPFTDPDVLASAKTQAGDPVIPPDAEISPEHFAMALSQITAASDAATPRTVRVRAATDRPSNVVDPAQLSQMAKGTSMAMIVSPTGGRPRMLVGEEARRALPIPQGRAGLSLKASRSLGDEISGFFGDIWSAIKSGIMKVGSWALHVAEEGLSLIVQLADGVVHLVLDTLEKLFEVLSWIAEKVLMGLAKFIAWVGQLFGWDDIILCHKVIANGVNAAFDWTVDSVEEIKTVADGILNGMAEKLTGQSLPSDVAETTFDQATTATTKIDDSPSDGYLRSPAGGFASYHMTYSGAATGDATVDVTIADVIKEFLETLAKVGGDIYDTVGSVITDIIEGVSSGTMTLGQLFTKIVDDILLGVLSAVKDTVDGFLNIVADVILLIKQTLNASIEIPFVTGFYKAIAQDDEFTILNMFSLLLAVPAATMVRIVGRSEVFDDIASLADPGITSEQFIDAVTYTPARSLSAAAATNGTGDQRLATAYSFIGGGFYMFASGCANLFSAANAAGMPSNKVGAWINTGLKAVIFGAKFPFYRGAHYGLSLLGALLRGISALTSYVLAYNSADAKLTGASNIVLAIAGLLLTSTTALFDFVDLLQGEYTLKSGLWALESLVGGYAGNVGLLAGGIASYDPEAISKEILAGVAIVGGLLSFFCDGGRWLRSAVNYPNVPFA